MRRHGDRQARLHGRRRGRLGAERAAGAARRGAGQPRPAVVLGDRARQDHARLDARRRRSAPAAASRSASTRSTRASPCSRRCAGSRTSGARPSATRCSRPGHFTIHPGVVTGGPKGVLVPFVIREFMTIEYCCWYHPDEDPEDVKREIETHVKRAASGPVAARAPARARVEAQLAGRSPSMPTRSARRRGRRTSWRPQGTRFAGRPEVNGFAAVEDATFLTSGGIAGDQLRAGRSARRPRRRRARA